MFRNPFRSRAGDQKKVLRAAIRPAIELLESRQLLSVSIIDGHQMEALDRGVIAVNKGGGQVYVGWRLLGTDPDDVTFNLYRSTNGAPATKLNAAPLSATTDFVNTSVDTAQSNSYFVRPVIDGVEQAPSETSILPAGAPVKQYVSIPLQIPAAVTTPDGAVHTYSANDSSVGDLDGDGDYEIVLKWESSASISTTYNVGVYLDAYETDGTLLWRAYSGKNIKTGSQFLQFIVYDLDGDGKAEVAFNSADGAVSGTGQVIGDPNADWRNAGGSYVTTGPEYLTLLNGQTGAILTNVNLQPARGVVTDWGDDYGHRSNTFNASIAYLDGQRPSLIFGRGIYHGRDGNPGQTQIVAWNWRHGQLTSPWTFTAAANGPNPTYVGQGNHQSTVGDVDGDGRDEIIWGAMAVDDNGQPLYTTRLGHGDALHMSDMDPSRPGLETFSPHESPSEYTRDTNGDGIIEDNGGSFRDAATGEVLFGIPGNGADVGRGVAMDIDPRPGFEMWTSASPSIYNVDGTIVATMPSNMFMNFGVWWDADLYREMLDATTISKWNYTTAGRSNFDLDPSIGGVQQYAVGASSNNSTKKTPALSADLFGDWREEVMWRTSDNTELRIFTTTIPATVRLDTLMHDRQYREAIAWQNVYYNQPPHTSFYLGNGMTLPAAAPTGLVATAASSSRVNLAWNASAGASSYNIKRATSASGPFTTIATGVTSATYADTGASADTTYYYFVTAVNSAGGSLNSNQANATTPEIIPVLTSIVVTPASASVNTNATRQFIATALDQFGAAMATQPAFTWSIATGSGSVSTTGLYTAPSAAGSATVRATSGAIAGNASVTIVLVAPSAPASLTATTASASQINLAWSDNANNETGFTIQRATNSSFTTGLTSANVGAGIKSYSATGLASNTTYYFRVHAYNTAGASGTTNTASAKTAASVTVPSAPTSLTAVKSPTTKARLKWVDKSSNETGFRIWTSRNGTTWTQLTTVAAASGTGTTVQFITNNLAKGLWYFRITAYNAAGNSGFSNTKTLNF